jgi:hypothetical protein
VDLSFVKTVLDETWEHNNKDLLFQELAQSCAVNGDVWVKVSLDTNEDEQEYVRIDAVNPAFCFPEFHERDKKKLKKFHILYPVYEENVIMERKMFSVVGEKPPTVTLSWYRETYTEKTIQYFLNDTLTETVPNVLGCIPVVHIRNFQNANSNYGASDVAVLIQVNKAYNESITDLKTIIDSYAAPQLFAKGVQASEFEKDLGKIWTAANTEAEVSVIKIIDDIKPSLDFINTLYRAFFDLSGVPEQAVNPTKNVSNTPGVALHMAYLPLINARSIKIKLFREGLRAVNRLILKVNELIDPAFSKKLGKLGNRKYISDVSFGEDLPRDEVQALSNRQQELTMGITTRADILLERGIGPSDVERILNEADVDFEKRLAIQAKYQAKEGDAFGKRRMPDPVVQGDKVSRQSG